MKSLVITLGISFLSSTVLFSQKVETPEKDGPPVKRTEAVKPAEPKPVKAAKLPDPKKLLKEEVKFYQENRKEVYANAAKEGTASKEYRRAKGDNSNVAPAGKSPKAEPKAASPKEMPKEKVKEEKVKVAKVEKVIEPKKVKAAKVEAPKEQPKEKVKEEMAKPVKVEKVKEPKPAKVKAEKPAKKKEEGAPANSKTIKLDELKKSQPKP